MDFWEVIEKRRSVREFDRVKGVSDENIKEILYAAKRAPSAGGLYPTDFIVVRDKETKKKLTRAALNQEFIAQAPVVIVVVADTEKSASRYGERGRNLYTVQDAAAAAGNLLLAVTALGLGACWVGAFDENEVKKILNLDFGKRPLTIIPVGWEK